MKMLPVDNRRQVLENLLVLNNACHSENPETRAVAISLLVRGKVFVVENIGGKLIYGPSRFVGYNGNTILDHGNNEGKHGGEANNALSKIYGSEITDSELTAQYFEFLLSHGFERKPVLQSDLKFFCERNSLARKPKCFFFSPTHIKNLKEKAWESFYAKGIAAIGWDDVDFTRWEWKRVEAELRSQNYSNITEALRSFKYLFEIRPGDVIVATNASHGLFGIGLATSAYKFKEGIHLCNGTTNSDGWYSHYIDVAWLTSTYVSKSNIPFQTEAQWEPYGALRRKETVPNYLQQILFPNLKKTANTPEAIHDSMEINLPINLIYYGPPGTGKTFKLNELKEENFTDKGISQTSEDALREQVSSFAFWRVLGSVLATANEPLSVGQIVEHPIVKARINPANKTKPNNLAWGELQSYANDESTQLIGKYRRSMKLFQKNEESKWSIAEDKRSEISNIIDPELLELAKNPTVQPRSDGPSKTRYNFITFHQKYGYEDFIEGIKPVLKSEDSEEEAGELQFELKKGIFYNSCIEALNLAGYQTFEECKKDTPANRELKFKSASENPKQSFALFIDEINRANISAVFGELITLLEDDKRIGAENEMWLTLPSSGEFFGVPLNLYLIGTMNTADRSIALVDIALRRRFEFKGLYPEYPENTWWGPILKSINEKIHAERKGADFFIGHAFFINKEESEKARIFNHKIIPLLLEYFQNNAEKVRAILKSVGIETEELSIENNFQIVVP